MTSSIRSALLVTGQFLGSAVIAFGGSWKALPAWSLVLLVASMLLVLWSALSLGRANLSIMPDPVPGNVLIRKGAYRWVRHPMYLAVLVASAAIACGAPTLVRLLALGGLVPAILLKIGVEERALIARHPEYAEKMAGTWRLVPFLW